MTVPSTIILPLHSEKVLSGEPKDLDKYIRELVFSLQTMYEQLAQGVNGDIRADFSEPGRLWTPLLKDSGDTTTTFTYDHQVGWVQRKGINVDVWFDIKWTAASAALTGNMYVELPYKVAVTNQKPFVGVAQPSIFTYTGGTECVINAISDTYRAEVWNCGSGFTTANQAAVTAGQLIGHIRYIGQQDET